MEGKTFRILIDGRDYDVELAINKTSDDIARMLPLRLFMQAFSNIEYYAELPDKPFFDEKVAITQAEKNALMYCREYNALVVVCRDHRDIYTEEEQEADSSKGNTGLFFFRGKPGMPVEVHPPEGAEHGLGVGNGTPAEGWISQAVGFWERNMKN